MNNGIKNTFIFVLGAAVGVAATWQYFKKKYEQIAQEEIDSVKEVFSRDRKAVRTENEAISEKLKELEKYKDIANKYSNEKEGGSEIMEDAPYVISPDEFGEDDYYDTISLDYYNDGVLADDMGDAIEDIEGTVGPDALNRFGEYEDDVVYVKNDRLKCYYEILKDYSDYPNPNPNLRVDE